MATFPSSPTIGTVYTVNDVKYIWNGYRWSSSAPLYLNNNLDVDLTTTPPVSGDALKYNGAQWVPGTITVPSTLDDLTDVVASGAVNGNTIVFNGTNWALGTISGSGSSFRNKLMNGTMFIDQRNPAGTSSVNSAGNNVGCDRWISNGTLASKMTIGRNLNSVTPPAGFSSYLGHQTTATTGPLPIEAYSFYTAIEGSNIQDLNFGTANAKTITVSFWFRASIVGTYCFSLRNGGSTHVYVATFSITAANTWQYVTVTIPGCTAGTWNTGVGVIGMYLRFDLGSGINYDTTSPNTWLASSTAYKTAACVRMISNASATVYITGVQLEVGSAATTYEHRSFDDELRRCKRHFQKSYPYTTALNTDTGDGRRVGLIGIGSTYFYDTVYLDTEMAFPPDVAVISDVNAFNTYRDNNGTKTISYGPKSTKFFNVLANNNATGGSSYHFNWWVSAEFT
jgi:hypothetical protein